MERSGASSSTAAGSASSAAPSADKILLEAMHKITQIIVRARIPAHAELEKSSHLNKWFNLHVPEWAGVRGELDVLLRSGSDGGGGGGFGGGGSASGSLLMSASGTLGPGSTRDTGPITSNVIQLDLLLRNAKNHTQYVLVERWNIQHERHGGSGGDVFNSSLLAQQSAAVAASRKTDPAAMYKKLLLLVRSLYTFVKLLPAHQAWKLSQACLERREQCAFVPGHQLGSAAEKGLAPAPMQGGTNIATPVFDQSPSHFRFASVATTAGKFTLEVFYRPELASVEFIRTAGVNLGRTAAATSSSSSSAPSHPAPAPSPRGDTGGATSPFSTSGGGEAGTIISDYMAAPETSRPHAIVDQQHQQGTHDQHQPQQQYGQSHSLSSNFSSPSNGGSPSGGFGMPMSSRPRGDSGASAHARLSYPPPVLGSSAPVASGLSHALAAHSNSNQSQQQQYGNTAANVQYSPAHGGSPSHHSHSPGGGVGPGGFSLGAQQQQNTNTRISASPSASNSPSMQPFGSAAGGGTSSRAIPIPASSRPPTGGGRSTPPYAGSGGGGAGSFSAGSSSHNQTTNAITSYSPSTAAAPSAGAIFIRQRDATQSPFATQSQQPNARVAFPPPMLGSSAPVSSGLSHALAGRSGSPAHGSPILTHSPGGGVVGGFSLASQNRLMASPSSTSPSMPPFSALGPNSSSRAIPIPAKPATTTSGQNVGSLFGRTPPFASGAVGSLGAGSFLSTGSVTALGLMKQSASISSSPPLASGLLSDGGLGGHAHRPSGSWHADGLPPPTIQQPSVAPFKAPSSQGRKSIINSPALTPQQLPMQRVHIAPQVMGFDLRATANQTHHTTDPASTSTLAFADEHAAAQEDDSSDAALGNFHEYITTLRSAAQQQPLQLFDDGGASASAAVSASSQLHASSASTGVRHTSVQALFEQMDRLAQSAHFQLGDLANGASSSSATASPHASPYATSPTPPTHQNKLPTYH